MMPVNYDDKAILFQEHNSLRECLDYAKEYLTNREGVELIYNENCQYYKCEVYKTQNGSFVYKTYKMDQA